MTDHTPPDDSNDIGLDGSDRRVFLKRAAIGAVAVPILTSFSMAGMNVASAQPPAVSGTTTTKASTTTSSTTTSSTTTTISIPPPPT